MRRSSCLMEAGCNEMRAYLKSASWWLGTTPPHQARGFRWASASARGCMRSSSRHCRPPASSSRMSSISLMGAGPRIAVLADEDVEEDEGLAGVPTRSADKNSGKSPGSRVWNLRLALGQEMQAGTLREIEWAPAKEAPSLCVAAENAPQEYGPWQWARAFG